MDIEEKEQRSNVRLVPRLYGDRDRVRNLQLDKAARMRLDFVVKDMVGIKYSDMLEEARGFFGRDSIKDLVDLSAGECSRLKQHLVGNLAEIRKRYPYWR